MSKTNPRPATPVEDFRTVFTADEVRAGLARVLHDDLAEAITRSMYADIATNTAVYGDLFSALSLVSPDCAARVRKYLNEDEQAEAKRLAEFRSRVQLR